MTIQIKLKKQIASLYKVFFVYRAGFRYVYYRYWVAPQIFRVGSLERPVTHPNVSMHMLTSHDDLLIALWSLGSYYATARAIGVLTIHDDGTMTPQDHRAISRAFPHARIVSVSDFLSRHGGQLSQYPTLRVFRETYKKFQSKKLIDVFFERQGSIILYLDSDLLWFRASEEMAGAIEKGCEDVSYMMSNGKDLVHVTFKDGTKTSDTIAECNSGVTLFHERNYDLGVLSEYIDRCDYLGRKFTDQACFGTVLKHVAILPREKYFIKGTITDETVMRHYTGPSREKFFFYGIPFLRDRILKSSH